ncbi:MAG: hypothetical protein M5R36_15725 [Deltaproteobacteria bacterium]|nr:hypothetical protein [Deltaproteobacteria bacterium]
MDGSDNVHISFDYVTGHDLYYATNTGGSWSIVPVTTSGDVGNESSIALDSLGYVHISYYDATADDLGYATNASGTWAASIVESTVNNDGRYTSIAIDSANEIWISYYDNTDLDLRVAHYSDVTAALTWTTELMYDNSNSGRYSTIAVDSSDDVHIGFQGDGAYLLYATNSTGTWAAETVDNDGAGGRTRRPRSIHRTTFTSRIATTKTANSAITTTSRRAPSPPGQRRLWMSTPMSPMRISMSRWIAAATFTCAITTPLVTRG